MSAVTKEAALIQNRIAAGKWAAPMQYAFVTNAPLTATHRQSISDVLQPILADCAITVQGALDVCAMLDTNLAVARSFPQILSLRNLFEILDQVVKNEIVQRTDAVLREADALSSVFVPTKAFDDAWEILDKHYFVVLEGPPEMGKTAIAWMIAAVMLAQKWHAVDCDKPEDFFGAYAPDRDQIFIADDAFGTAEYDVNRGNEWGRQLHKVIPKLDKRHWLVWTSRMHILQRALQDMSLQGSASRFPDHKEVLVKANRIEGNERALMLYRHARAANLDDGAKTIIRKYAKSIVDNQHFTPERIRRFVREALSGLQNQIATGELDDNALAAAVTEAIENPTERMRKSYRQLDDEQRSILVSMLDCERSPTIEGIDKARARFQLPRRPTQEEINLLKEGFLQDSTTKASYLRNGTILPAMAVDWIHPSYRDLVIEELERDAPASGHFLQNCSWEGLQLTLSIAGGEKGQRRYPLMTSEGSWVILENRLNTLLAETSQPYQIREILQALRTSLDGTTGMEDVHKKLARIIHTCCGTVRARLDRQEIELNERTTNLLAGRAVMRNMHPLVPAELNEDFDLERVLRFGSIPVIWQSEDPRAALEAYVQLYVKEEIRAEALVRNLPGFLRFLNVAGLIHGQVINISGLARDAATARSTVQGYLSILQDTLLATLLPAFEPRLRVRERQHPKLYWVDPGLARAAKRQFGPVGAEERGALFEGWILGLLRAHNEQSDLFEEIAYWAPAQARQTEVDFLLRLGRNYLALEVKSSSRFSTTLLSGLRAIGELDRLVRRILIYFGDQRLRTDEGIEVWPLHVFLDAVASGKLWP